MSKDEARKILSLYRPEIDANDPQFAEALREAENDPDLSRWLAEQGAVYRALRGKFTETPIPENLVEKVLLQRPLPWWRHSSLQLAASILILASLAYIWFGNRPKQATFDDYRTAMARVIGKYRMSLESSDADRVRQFLANNQAPADYAVPASLARQQLLGCATLSWDGSPVSLLCFRHQNGPELWLFITHRSNLPGNPGPGAQLGDVNAIATASWTHDHNLYVLATRGDPKLLKETYQ